MKINIDISESELNGMLSFVSQRTTERNNLISELIQVTFAVFRTWEKTQRKARKKTDEDPTPSQESTP